MANGNGKTRGSRPLADFVDPCIASVLAHHGFGHTNLVTLWPDIVGARVASYAEPIRLQWRRGVKRRVAGDAPEARAPATLILRVEGGGALELQHMAATVIERINTHLGWRCVGKLAMRQEPLVGRPPAPPRPPPPPPQAIAAARASTSGIADDALRDALVRLGARVVERSRAGADPDPRAAPIALRTYLNRLGFDSLVLGSPRLPLDPIGIGP